MPFDAQRHDEDASGKDLTTGTVDCTALEQINGSLQPLVSKKLRMAQIITKTLEFLIDHEHRLSITRYFVLSTTFLRV
jgi:hypothetical protein